MKNNRESPYQGLIPYNESDAPFFFGRNAEVSLLVANMFASPLTLLYGPSGAGKTSILRAGLVHQLRSREDIIVVNFNRWQVDVIKALKYSINEAASDATGEMIEVKSNFTSLPQCIFEITDQFKRRVMIILDQFEEFFLYHPEIDSTTEEIAAAIMGTYPASFLISIREDYFTKLDRFEGLISGLFDNLFRLERLNREAAAEAIVKPVEQYNQLIAGTDRQISIDHQLVGAVIEQVKVGSVFVGNFGQGKTNNPISSQERIETPYLQLVMTRLWDEETRLGSQVLRMETLFQLGGAQQIVRNHLQKALESLSPDEQGAAARIFDYLVTPSGTKIAHSIPDLAAYAALSENEIRPILDKLSEPKMRILRQVEPLLGQEANLRFEIFHDILAPAVIEWKKRYGGIDRLTEREREFMILLAQDLPYSEIALQLSVSVDSVRRRAKAIQNKLNLESRNDLAVFAGANITYRSRQVISAIESNSRNQAYLSREFMNWMVNQLANLAPDFASGGEADELLVNSLEKTKSLVLEFALIAEAVAINNAAEAAEALYRGFEHILVHYHPPFGFSGSFYERDFDFYRFMGHELFVTLFSFLIRESRFNLIGDLLSNEFYVANLPNGIPGLVPFGYIASYVRLFDYRNDRLKLRRLSIHADLLNERHTQGDLGKVTPMQEFIEADYFLFIRSELAEGSADSRYSWIPWSTLYLGQRIPRFLTNAYSKKFAQQLIVSLNVPNVETLRLKLKERAGNYTNYFRDSWKRDPLSGFNADLVATR